MFCTGCGAEITAHGAFCGVCGASSAGAAVHAGAGNASLGAPPLFGRWKCSECNKDCGSQSALDQHFKAKHVITHVSGVAKTSAAEAKRAAWEIEHPDGQAFSTLTQPIAIKHVSGSAAKTGADAKVQLCECSTGRDSAYPAWQSKPDIPGRPYEVIGVCVDVPGKLCGLKILGGSSQVSLIYNLANSRFEGSTANPTQVDMYRISNNQKPENGPSNKPKKDPSLTSWSFGSAAQRDAWLTAIRRVESVVASENNARAFAYFGGALWYPAMRGDHQRVAQLLLAGASYGLPDKKRNLGPMHVAAEAGHVAIMELLVDAGDSVNLVSAAGQTPLHSAAMEGQVKAIEWLKAHKADESLRCGQFSAWDYAKKYKHGEALKLLSANTSGFLRRGGGGGGHNRHYHGGHYGGGGGVGEGVGEVMEMGGGGIEGF